LLFLIGLFTLDASAQNRSSTLHKTSDLKKDHNKKIIGKQKPDLQLASIDTNHLSIAFSVLPVEVLAYGIQINWSYFQS